MVLCCKTRKLQRQEFFAKTRSGRRSPIRIPSVAVPRSPVSLTREDQSPHVLTRKTRLQPAEILITCAKRLLQHNRMNSRSGLAALEAPLMPQMLVDGAPYGRNASPRLADRISRRRCDVTDERFARQVGSADPLIRKLFGGTSQSDHGSFETRYVKSDSATQFLRPSNKTAKLKYASRPRPKSRRSFENAAQ